MDEMLLQFGDAVKALGNGRVAGYLVRFGDEAQVDVDGEFFTKATDFDAEFPRPISTYYHHGFDERLGRERLTRGEVKADDCGLWFEAQLKMSDRYQAMIYRLAEAGRLGLSSGAVTHLVQKKPAGKAVRITTWPLGEASFTPMPADPRCIVAVKSWCESAPSFDDLVAQEPQIKTSGEQPEPEALETRPSLTEHSKAVVSANAEYVERMEDRLAFRLASETKTGRMLSHANIGELEAVLQSLAGVKDVEDRVLALLEKARPAPAEPPCLPTEEALGLYATFLQTDARLAGVPV